jgi:hypothetical protein
MGADSSTIQGVQSLGATLDQIERRLRDVEDYEIHHERSICNADTVVVSGKQILCRPGIHIVVGPVIGIVGQTFARFLVETNVDVELRLNIFDTTKQLPDSRFCFEHVST